jgi:hypothetical protein
MARYYPAKGAHRLDEADGQLFYQGRLIGPTPDRRYSGIEDRIVSFGHALHRQLEAAIGSGFNFYAARCRHWATGSGYIWCSPECRSAGRAQVERDRRSKATAERPQATCPMCGTPVRLQRSTRRFCSNACRQAAYRSRPAAT